MSKKQTNKQKTNQKNKQKTKQNNQAYYRINRACYKEERIKRFQRSTSLQERS